VHVADRSGASSCFVHTPLWGCWLPGRGSRRSVFLLGGGGVVVWSETGSSGCSTVPPAIVVSVLLCTCVPWPRTLGRVGLHAIIGGRGGKVCGGVGGMLVLRSDAHWHWGFPLRPRVGLAFCWFEGVWLAPRRRLPWAGGPELTVVQRALVQTRCRGPIRGTSSSFGITFSAKEPWGIHALVVRHVPDVHQQKMCLTSPLDQRLPSVGGRSSRGVVSVTLHVGRPLVSVVSFQSL